MKISTPSGVLTKILVFAGKQSLGFLSGNFAGIALGHNLHVLVVELVAQVEEGGDYHANDGYQCIDDPQTGSGLVAELDVHGGQFVEAVGFDLGEGKPAQQSQRQSGGHSAGNLHREGLNSEGDTLGADAGLVLTIFSTVGGEHKGQYAHQTQRNGSDGGQHHKQGAVFETHEINHKAQDNVDDVTPEQGLKLIQLLENGGHQHGGDDAGDHAQQVQQNGVQFAAKQEEGNEQRSGSGGFQRIGGHVAAVVGQ